MQELVLTSMMTSCWEQKINAMFLGTFSSPRAQFLKTIPCNTRSPSYIGTTELWQTLIGCCYALVRHFLIWIYDAIIYYVIYWVVIIALFPYSFTHLHATQKTGVHDAACRLRRGNYIIDGQTGFPHKMNIVILCYIRTITSKSTAV